MDALKFKGWMAENRVSQQELCEVLKLSMTSINKKVNGKEDFTLSQIKVLCEKYGISADIFL